MCLAALTARPFPWHYGERANPQQRFDNVPSQPSLLPQTKPATPIQQTAPQTPFRDRTGLGCDPLVDPRGARMA